MSRSLTSSLKKQEKQQLLGLFPRRVDLHLLYKSSYHGQNMSRLRSLCSDQGSFVLLLFSKSGIVSGGFLSKSFPNCHVTTVEDEDAFVFSVQQNSAVRFSVVKPWLAFKCNNCALYFGESLQLKYENGSFHSVFRCDDAYEYTGWYDEQICEVELHRVEAGDVLSRPWRNMQWTELERDQLRNNLVSYKPYHEELTQVRVLLLGPVGAGKSSFINSVRSVLHRHVMNLPIIGAEPHGFTKKLKSYPVRAEKGGPATALILCDTMAVGDHSWEGLSIHDTLAIVKGHVPEGYEFSPNAPIRPRSAGYCKDPPLKDRIHCVVFTLDASEVPYSSSGLKETLTKLHREISDLDVPQLVFLTHVDEVCHAVQRDLRYMYSSRIIQEKMQKAAELVEMPVLSVLPIKNYCSEVAVDRDTDILLLNAVDKILNSIDDSFEG